MLTLLEGERKDVPFAVVKRDGIRKLVALCPSDFIVQPVKIFPRMKIQPVRCPRPIALYKETD